MIRKYFFRGNDDDFTRKLKANSSELMTKNSKTKLNNNSFSSTKRTCLTIPYTNNQSLLNRKKESDDLNNFYLSDISENENSQLFDQVKDSSLCNFNEKLEKNEKKILKNNLSENFHDKSNGEYLKTCKNTLSIDSKTNKSKFNIFERFLTTRKKSNNNNTYESQSNDIILIRV